MTNNCECGTTLTESRGFNVCPSCGTVHDQVFETTPFGKYPNEKPKLAECGNTLRTTRSAYSLLLFESKKAIPLKIKMLHRVESFCLIFDEIPKAIRYNALELWRKIYAESKMHRSSYVMYIACLDAIMSRRGLTFNIVDICTKANEHGYWANSGYIRRIIMKSTTLSKIYISTSAYAELDGISPSVMNIVSDRYPDKIKSCIRTISRKMIEISRNTALRPKNIAALSMISAIQIMDSAYGLHPRLAMKNIAEQAGVDPDVIRFGWCRYYREKTTRVATAVNNNPEKLRSIFKIG